MRIPACAQRLSASLIHSHPTARLWAVGLQLRAQRLSASLIHSRDIASPLDRCRSVLCSTPFGITDLSQSTVSPRQLETYKCSTPFGITDPFAQCHSETRECRRLRCSTPFGITDPFALSVARDPTPRTASAQRLSASLILSLAASTCGAIVPSRCSTPFGITDPFGAPAGTVVTPQSVCSTPFGITDPSYCFSGRRTMVHARSSGSVPIMAGTSRYCPHCVPAAPTWSDHTGSARSPSTSPRSSRP